MSMSISERNNLIIENLEIIKMIARNCKIKTADLDDLYQDAFEISLKVIQNYKPEKGSLISLNLPVNFLTDH